MTKAYSGSTVSVRELGCFVGSGSKACWLPLIRAAPPTRSALVPGPIAWQGGPAQTRFPDFPLHACRAGEGGSTWGHQELYGWSARVLLTSQLHV